MSCTESVFSLVDFKGLDEENQLHLLKGCDNIQWCNLSYNVPNVQVLLLSNLLITIKLKLFYLDSESDLGYGSQTARNSKTVLDPSQFLHTLLLSAHLYLAKLDNEMHIRDI